MSIFNLSETRIGSFTANAKADKCNGRIDNGEVTADGRVTFDFQQQVNFTTLCDSTTVSFRGQLNAAGGISGTWTGPGNGSFSLS